MSIELEPNREYTAEELKTLYGDNFINIISPTIYLPEPNKPIIYSFNDFDLETKNIYRLLFNLIKEINNNDNLLLFAVGDRVIGKWRTPQETATINNQYDLNLQNSSYDYWTDAKILPTTQQLYSSLSSTNVNFSDTNKTHRVIIPPSNE